MIGRCLPVSVLADDALKETFMLSESAQNSLPQDAQVALQQVDNRKDQMSPLKTVRGIH